MLLRRVSEHVKAQNWTAVGLDFLVVIIGILIAFQITSWNENRQAREKLERVEEVLQGDLFLTYLSAKERISIGPCRQQALLSTSERLLEPGGPWAGLPREGDTSIYPTALLNLLRSPYRPWGSRVWNAELGQGTFNLMEDGRRDLIDSIMRQSGLAQDLQSEIYALQGRLKVLAVSTDIPKSDRLRYYDMLGELDDRSALLEVLSGQIVSSIDSVGIDASAEDVSAFPNRLSDQNEYAARVYGDCYIPITTPLLDDWVKEGAAP